MKKKKFFAQRRGMTNRVLSLVLAFIMVITTVLTMPGLRSSVQAEENKVTIKVHFQNKGNWDSVNAFYGDCDINKPDGQKWTKVLSVNEQGENGWPGEPVDPDPDHSNDTNGKYYTVEVEKDKSSDFGIIFNGGGKQTNDLFVSKDEFKNDICEFWVYWNEWEDMEPYDNAPDGWFTSPRLTFRRVR